MSQSHLFSKFFASVLAISTDFIPKEKCISEKCLLDFNVCESKFSQYVIVLILGKALVQMSNPLIYLNYVCVLTANHWAFYYTKLNKQVSSLLVRRALLLAQLSEKGGS